MTVNHSPDIRDFHRSMLQEGIEDGAAAESEHELERQRAVEFRLRKALAESKVQLRQKDDLIRRREELRSENDHRLMNGLQMVSSLLSLQAKASAYPEVTSQLGIAAKRIGLIARIHRRLHSFDKAQVVAFKAYLDDLCSDLSGILMPNERRDRDILVTGVEIELPTATAVPLGFIASELITNAAKHGEGQITVRLEQVSAGCFVLSVSNFTFTPPASFAHDDGKGQGMTIVNSLARQIGAEVSIARGDECQGVRIAVQFAHPCGGLATAK